MGLAGDLEAFTLLAEAGSFPAAGRRLNLAPSSVARVTDRIEARLGVRLLLRTTRSLTPEGTAYLSSARRPARQRSVKLLLTHASSRNAALFEGPSCSSAPTTA